MATTQNATPSLPASDTSTATDSAPRPPQHDIKAWKTVLQFVTSDMGLAQAEGKLEGHLGIQYKEINWRMTLKAVMDTENNTNKALESLDKLTMKIFGCQICQLHQQIDQPLVAHTIGSQVFSTPPELQRVEQELQECINELVKCTKIIGKPLTLEEDAEVCSGERRW